MAGNQAEQFEIWSDKSSFSENIEVLLNLDYNYAPWNTEKHDPEQSAWQFAEGCAMPVTSFIDIPSKFDFEAESRMCTKMIASLFPWGQD